LLDSLLQEILYYKLKMTRYHNQLRELEEICNSQKSQANELGRETLSMCNRETSWNFQEAYQKIDELNTFSQRKENEDSEIVKDRQGLVEAEKNIQALKEQTTALKQNIHETNRNMEASHERLRHEMAQMSGSEADRRVKELEAQLTKLGSALGLNVIRSTHGSLILTFSNLDRANPDQVNSIEIKVVDRKWTFVHSNPDIQNIDEMVRILNETNNLSGFISSARRVFVKIAKQE